MTLWTPDGERPVNRDPEPAPNQAPGAPPSTPSQGAPPQGAPPAAASPGAPLADEPELTPEQQEQARQMAAQMAEARAQLLEADVADVVANHAMGLYELAAIHLTTEECDLPSARLAVDALGTLVDGLEGRLGQHEETLNEALHQARMAFVQRSQGTAEAPSDSPTN